MRLLRNLGVVSGMTLISRVAGFLREILTAAYLGAGPVADTFFQALMVPNTFRRVLAEGAFNAAFVPLYARELEGKDQEEADRFATEALSALVTFTALIVIGFQVAAPWLAYVFVPGAIGDPDRLAFAALLLQITMPYLLTMAVVALVSGTLNSHGRFAASAFAPVMLNLVLIVLLALDFAEGERLATWLSIGVTVSGVLQALLLVVAARARGLHVSFRPPRLTPRVKRLVVLGVPGALAAGVTQINVLVTSSIATLEVGARSWLNYSERLYQLPLGVIGIAMGVALLPNLARRVRSGDEQGGHFTMNRAIELSLALTLPAAAAFLVIPEFLIRGLFERLNFTALDTEMTALALMVFALGLPAFVMIKVLQPGFFAREDTRTPMIFSLISVGVNFVLALALFFGPLGFVGLALATSAAGWSNCLLLAFTLRRRGLLPVDRRLARSLPRIVLASALMGAIVWAMVRFEALWLAPMAQAIGPAWAAVVGVLLVSAAGAAVYAGACLVTGAVKVREIGEAMKPRAVPAPEVEDDKGP
ncbi:MAG: murein biosynthesis integral membrane protein MurJ [Oceanicaulis sp.]